MVQVPSGSLTLSAGCRPHNRLQSSLPVPSVTSQQPHLWVSMITRTALTANGGSRLSRCRVARRAA